MNLWQIMVLPLVGALIGWLTNLIAVKLIFRPYQPVNILGYSLQGVVPKRRRELAKNIGEVIEKELLSADDMLGFIKSREVLDGIEDSLATAIRMRVLDRLPAFIPISVKTVISDSVTEQLHRHLPSLIAEITEKFEGRFKERFNIGQMVEEKVNSFPLDRLEQILLSVSHRELKHIEILGGVLGFIIGLAQVGILWLVR
ncbi:hypothetical protein DCCM_0906 [Desulfocucumis palustris]|uniref:DUF445 domain-containing protein n=1 Tax=Desulfocucumis palustris TaxID=1898651 RepID=A0A2L2X9J3_9FIRM|nr:DUF445 family protein [Desulfocucumis palustris]GBF32710.1 hypothetical protein DCCM_0906 [Desulfocucumis palustris]